MVQIAPHLNWPLYNLVGLARQSNRPAEALEVASRRPDFFVGNWSGILLKAHHMLGNYEEQLNGARIALEEIPDRGDFYFHEAAALAALGRADEVDAVIDRCLSVALTDNRSSMDAGTVMTMVAAELRAHGHPEKSGELARRAVEWFEGHADQLDAGEREPEDLATHVYALHVAGRWEASGELLMELEQRRWQPVTVTGGQGAIAAHTGDQDEARRIFDELAGMDDRDNPGSTWYWRAAIAAQLGEKDRAVELLRRGYAEGLIYSWAIHCDIDLEPLWDYPPFQELIAPKG